MSDLLIKYAGTGLTAIFSQVRQNSTHIEFLDPICTILKLCVLNFKPIGSKISIRNNIIHIQDNSYMQTFFRSFNNDCREDIHQLKAPILYFKTIESGYIKLEDKDLILILSLIKKFAIGGLTKLRSTYEMGKNATMISSCINDYIRILKKADFNTEDYKSEMINVNGSLMTIYSEFMKLWSINDLIPIKAILETIEKKTISSDDLFSPLCNIESYATAIYYLIEAKEKELNSMRH